MGRKTSFILNWHDDLPYYQSSLLAEKDNLVHAFSTRWGGVSQPPCDTLNVGFAPEDAKENTVENLKLFWQAVGLGKMPLIRNYQVHGSKAVYVSTKPYRWYRADGLVTDQENLVLGVMHADCVPVLLFDPIKKVIGAAHSGWKSTVKGIISSILALMEEKGAERKNILAVVGPAIGDCCYEIREDVVKPIKEKWDWWKEVIKSDRQGRIFLNLEKSVFLQLLENKIKEENIELSHLCTSCYVPREKHLFFSYRRDKEKTGSMISVIALTKGVRRISFE